MSDAEPLQAPTRTADPPTGAGTIASALDTEPHVFDLDGGRACLDFANTLGVKSGEALHSFGDLVAFAEQSALVTPADAAWLRAEARRDPAGAEHVLEDAKQLR